MLSVFSRAISFSSRLNLPSISLLYSNIHTSSSIMAVRVSLKTSWCFQALTCSSSAVRYTSIHHQLGRQVGRIQKRTVPIPKPHLEATRSRIPPGERQISSLCLICLPLGFVIFHPQAVTSVYTEPRFSSSYAHRS